MRVDDIIETVRGYSPDADINVIIQAYMFSAQAHNGQLRKSGEDYLTHPLAVAQILAEMRMDVDTIATGLLHDTMEDCLTTQEEISRHFGVEVADMVDGVTKIGKLQFRTKEEAQAENFRKLILAMSRDIRVILVKLADRLHNMRTMEHMRADRQKDIAQETMDIFAPIANRLGLSRLKSELEDLSFRFLHPELYADLAAQIQQRAPDHEGCIREVVERLHQGLQDRGLQSTVTGRVKHTVSIYRKMQSKNLELEQIHDLLAFRILTQDVGQCYTALGAVHAIYPHVPGRFKDYIAQPKSNGYQSLHTVVVTPQEQEIEVQIRTWDMHRFAEVGIAAHWQYKEGHLTLSREEISKISRLRTLFEVAQDISDPTEFLETLKIDLFADEIFVFTPRGDVKFFPQGATALDFAYAIHTRVGDTCTGAKVDGRMVPLRYELKNGDRLEILTSPTQTPNRDWLRFAKTGRALSKIRRYVREEEREKGRILGRDLLEAELKKLNTSLSKLGKSGKLDEVAQSFGHRRPDQLYLDIAQGNTTLLKVIQALAPEERPREEPLISNLTSLFFRRKKAINPVLIDGEDSMMTTYARCCGPLPGEAVVGYITRGRGITVHKVDCKQLKDLEPERRVDVEWTQDAKSRHTAEIEIICADKPGMLADVGAVCKTLDINVSRMSAESLDDGRAVLRLDVAVHNVEHLDTLRKNTERIKGVLRFTRL